MGSQIAPDSLADSAAQNRTFISHHTKVYFLTQRKYYNMNVTISNLKRILLQAYT